MVYVMVCDEPEHYAVSDSENVHNNVTEEIEQAVALDFML